MAIVLVITTVVCAIGWLVRWLTITKGNCDTITKLKEGMNMKAGLKDLCGALSAVMSAMATVSAIAAIGSGDRNLYVQAVVYGLIGSGVALAALMRM